MDERDYNAARKKVKAKKGFYAHFGVYIATGIFFILMNALTFQEDPEIWAFYPIVSWGLGILIHYFTVFGLPGIGPLDKEWEDKEIEKELDKVRSRSNSEPIQDDFDTLDLEDDSLDLKAQKKIDPRYRDSDLV